MVDKQGRIPILQLDYVIHFLLRWMFTRENRSKQQIHVELSQKAKSLKLFPFVKMVDKQGGIPVPLQLDYAILFLLRWMFTRENRSI